MKRCPYCGEVQSGECSFCQNCGKTLPPAGDSRLINGAVAVDSVSAAGKMMGDKNVIAGDVHLVGSQNTYHTTNVINQDETKKVVVCHVCGRNMTVDHSVDCPGCHQKTCEKCFDFQSRYCVKCINKLNRENIECYKTALKKALEDGIITIAERLELNALRARLKISEKYAEALEQELSSSFKTAGNSELTMFEKASLTKAQNLLWDDGNVREAWPILYELYKNHNFDEKVVSLLVECAENLTSEDKVMKIISDLKADVLGVKLVEFRLALKRGDLSSAEKQINIIEQCWPDNLLVTYHKALCYLAMADKLGEDFFVQQAQILILKAAEPQEKLESSWLCKLNHSIAIACDEKPEDITREYCQEKNLYHYVASSFFIGENRKEKNAAIRREARQKIVPLLVSQYCTGQDFNIGKENVFTIGNHSCYVPPIASTNKMLEEFIGKVNSGTEKACWCKNGVIKSCDSGKCGECLLCSNCGDPKQKISDFREFCERIELAVPDPDEDLITAAQNAESIIAAREAEKEEDDSYGEEENGEDDSEVSADYTAVTEQLVRQYCSGEDFTVKAGTFDFDDEEFAFPDICSTNQMLREFIENIHSGSDEACWCNNGVVESCDDVECENCILCSINDDPENKILAFRAFCENLDIDCPDPDEEIEISGDVEDEKRNFDEMNEMLTAIKDPHIFFGRHFNSKKLNNALETYVTDDIAPEDVLVQVDDTVFGNAKDGCIITADKIYVKDVSGKRTAVITPESVWRLDGRFFYRELILDGEPVFSYTQPETPEMEKLVLALNKM